MNSALWFLDTLNLNLESVRVKDSVSGKEYDLGSGQKQGKQYCDLTEEEKNKVKTILWILDRDNVGDAAYHEVTMIENGLARSYLTLTTLGSQNFQAIYTGLPRRGGGLRYFWRTRKH